MSRNPQIENLFEARHEPELLGLLNNWPLAALFRLDPGSTVVVAGCYTGIVMELLASLYPGLDLHGFDPQPWAIERARDRLSKFGEPNRNLASAFSLHAYGLWTKTATLDMGEWETDACSLFRMKDGRVYGKGAFVEYAEALKLEGIEHIDLAVVNMEGAEYELLQHILDADRLKDIDRLAVQWHVDTTPFPPIARVGTMISDIGDSMDLVYDNGPEWTYHERHDA